MKDHIAIVFSGKRSFFRSLCELLSFGAFESASISNRVGDWYDVPEECAKLAVIQMLKQEDKESLIEFECTWKLNGELVDYVQELIHGTKRMYKDWDKDKWRPEIRVPAGIWELVGMFLCHRDGHALILTG